ncbi:MAG: hypothetical protein EA375_02420 [Acholeplasmataceae bacterium]|nr:MAG: hypothetical protein EA375_02420 [Acholeplasmataceae bacterium]
MRMTGLLKMTLLVFVLVFLVACRGNITIDSETESIILMEGDTHDIGFETNDRRGITFHSSNETILTVDEEGHLVALRPGVVTVTLRSVRNPDISITINVTVRKLVSLTMIESEIEMIAGDEALVPYESNDDVTFASDDVSVVSVDADGMLLAQGAGQAVVTVYSVSDPEQSVTLTVHVLGLAESMTIEGPVMINVGTERAYEVLPLPPAAVARVTWTTDDADIATVDELGVLTAHAEGTVTLLATSTDDETVTATLVIEVVNLLMVDALADDGDAYVYEGLTLVYGERLFTTVQDALDVAHPGATMIIKAGTYVQDLTISSSGLTLIGEEDVVLNGDIVINADDVTLMHLSFIGNAKVTGHQIEGFVFEHNHVGDITTTAAFLHLAEVNGIRIANNVFDTLAGDAILVEDVQEGLTVISHNTITHAVRGIVASLADDAGADAAIQVVRNSLTNIHTGLTIEQPSTALGNAYARFNAVSGFTHLAAVSNEGSTVEFTLNYWGADTLDDAWFDNIEPLYLRGHYATAAAIISEAAYDPALPVKIIITNPIIEMELGDSYQLQYDILPMDLETDRIRFITSDPSVLLVNTLNGTLTPVKSGQATITVRSTVNFGINTTITIVIITDPGVDLSTTSVNNDITVGDSFTLEAVVFPIDIADDPVVFSSDDPLIASVDPYGVVTAHMPGVVTLTVALFHDPDVKTTYTFEVFDELDETNLLDLLTMYQIMYATPHEWLVFGMGGTYAVHAYESVSRFYFGDIPINSSKIVPISSYVRPGEPMTPHPPGITPFNEHHVYWVVVHDTGNGAPGSGALAHANYLYNKAFSNTPPHVSWHFTIDDTYIYQHLPETERGFHAGDGSTLVGQHSTYLGGGNRNGIGLEMAINQDGEMYRTWQRSAKLVADLLVRYNLPRDHMKYHQDFSGKTCPQTLINSGLMPVFEEFADIEYIVRMHHHDADITFVSHDPDYLDDTGRVIKMPDRALTVSYTVTVTIEGVTHERVFYTYLPGTLR